MTNTALVLCGPQPLGWTGLWMVSLSFVIVDATASTPLLFATSSHKPHPRTPPYLGTRVLRQLLSVCDILTWFRDGTRHPSKVSEICWGKAYFATTLNLANYILMDFMNKKTKTVH